MFISPEELPMVEKEQQLRAGTGIQYPKDGDVHYLKEGPREMVLRARPEDDLTSAKNLVGMADVSYMLKKQIMEIDGDEGDRDDQDAQDRMLPASMFEACQNQAERREAQRRLPLLRMPLSGKLRIRLLSKPCHYWLHVGHVVYRPTEHQFVDFDSNLPARPEYPMEPGAMLVRRFRQIVIDRADGCFKQIDYGETLYYEFSDWQLNFAEAPGGRNGPDWFVKTEIYGNRRAVSKALWLDKHPITDGEFAGFSIFQRHNGTVGQAPLSFADILKEDCRKHTYDEIQSLMIARSQFAVDGVMLLDGNPPLVYVPDIDRQSRRGSDLRNLFETDEITEEDRVLVLRAKKAGFSILWADNRAYMPPEHLHKMFRLSKEFEVAFLTASQSVIDRRRMLGCFPASGCGRCGSTGRIVTLQSNVAELVETDACPECREVYAHGHVELPALVDVKNITIECVKPPEKDEIGGMSSTMESMRAERDARYARAKKAWQERIARHTGKPVRSLDEILAEVKTAKEPEPGTLLDETEAAALLGVERSSLREIVATDMVRAYSAAGALKFRYDDLKEFKRLVRDGVVHLWSSDIHVSKRLPADCGSGESLSLGMIDMALDRLKKKAKPADCDSGNPIKQDAASDSGLRAAIFVPKPPEEQVAQILPTSEIVEALTESLYDLMTKGPGCIVSEKSLRVFEKIFHPPKIVDSKTLLETYKAYTGNDKPSFMR